MPCTDGGPSYEQQIDARNIPAMLCALASVLERDGTLAEVLARIDWQEAGVPREWFAPWWRQHKAEDARRRRWEREAREAKELRREAAAKLTPEERAALGLP